MIHVGHILYRFGVGSFDKSFYCVDCDEVVIDFNVDEYRDHMVDVFKKRRIYLEDKTKRSNDDYKPKTV